MTRIPLLALLLALLLGACAQSPAGRQAATGAPPVDTGDPWENTNRRILDFNLAVDDCCIRPVALGYRDAVPSWVRTRVRNVINNMDEPRFVANNLLQGRPLAAGESLMRFFINSTMGLGGMFDMAQFGGPERKPRDFGQTLHAWGLPGGPYLMLPIAGPSNPRDTVGMVTDGFLNPLNWLIPIWGIAARDVVWGIDAREQTVEALDALRAESLDFYARLRSVARQRRAAELGLATPEGVGLDVLDDPGEEAPPSR
ncbi:MlaA family lipoprotein [Crenalkalicoccus roseus]|uniref:MlaA family lipoprotein n=1 Tax=Crenalkalicoccus roseus TaxID=1485588 RepID=UPI0010811FE3|nr:VacJ family lipoprotein [Crenalkalicoccus roseus]